MNEHQLDRLLEMLERIVVALEETQQKYAPTPAQQQAATTNDELYARVLDYLVSGV